MDEQLKNDYDTINRAWQILKKYHEIVDSKAWWDELIKDVSELEVCGCLANEIGTAIINTLDARNASLQRYGDITHDAEIAIEKKQTAYKQREEERRKLREWRATWI